MSTFQQMTIEDCKVALADILNAFKLPENVSRIDEAQYNAGNDMVRGMQIVFPVKTQIQMEVIGKYGFSVDGEGVIRFTREVMALEREDPEIAQMYRQLRHILIPPIAGTSVGTFTQEDNMVNS
ncbi:hypothetical protein ScPMuIL_010151 [Solemya velum]